MAKKTLLRFNQDLEVGDGAGDADFCTAYFLLCALETFSRSFHNRAVIKAHELLPLIVQVVQQVEQKLPIFVQMAEGNISLDLFSDFGLTDLSGSPLRPSAPPPPAPPPPAPSTPRAADGAPQEANEPPSLSVDQKRQLVQLASNILRVCFEIFSHFARCADNRSHNHIGLKKAPEDGRPSSPTKDGHSHHHGGHHGAGHNQNHHHAGSIGGGSGSSGVGVGVGGNAPRARTSAKTLRKRRKKIVRYMNEIGLIRSLVDCLCTLQLLTNQNPAMWPICKLQMRLLDLSRYLIQCEKATRDDPFTEAHGLQVLIDYVGWPNACIVRSLEPLEWSVQDPVILDAYYQVQVMAVEVLVDTLSARPNYKQRAFQRGLFERLSHFALWVSVFFRTEKNDTFLSSLQSSSAPMEYPINPYLQYMDSKYSPLPNRHVIRNISFNSFAENDMQIPPPGPAPRPHNKHFSTVFERLVELANLSALFADEGMTTPPPTENNGKPATTTAHIIAHMRESPGDLPRKITLSPSDPRTQTLGAGNFTSFKVGDLPLGAKDPEVTLACLPFEIFRQVPEDGPCQELVVAMRALTRSAEFQVYCLDAIIGQIFDNPSIIEIFLQTDLYNTLFSKHFFLSGIAPPTPVPPAPTPSGEDTAAAVLTALKPLAPLRPKGSSYLPPRRRSDRSNSSFNAAGGQDKTRSFGALSLDDNDSSSFLPSSLLDPTPRQTSNDAPQPEPEPETHNRQSNASDSDSLISPINLRRPIITNFASPYADDDSEQSPTMHSRQLSAFSMTTVSDTMSSQEQSISQLIESELELASPSNLFSFPPISIEDSDMGSPIASPTSSQQQQPSAIFAPTASRPVHLSFGTPDSSFTDSSLGTSFLEMHGDESTSPSAIGTPRSDFPESPMGLRSPTTPLRSARSVNRPMQSGHPRFAELSVSPVREIGGDSPTSPSDQPPLSARTGSPISDPGSARSKSSLDSPKDTPRSHQSAFNRSVSRESPRSQAPTPSPSEMAEYELQITLREYILDFVKFISTRNDRDNVEEVKSLLSTLQTHCEQDDVLVLVGSTLFEVMFNKFKYTQDSLLRSEGLTKLSVVVDRVQSRAARVAQMTDSVAASRLLLARSVLLGVLDSLLSSDLIKKVAVKDTATNSALFSCLLDVSVREFALTNIFNLLNAKGMEYDDLHGLAQRFTHLFPDVQRRATEDNLRLLVDMLCGIQVTIHKENGKILKKVYRDVSFIQIVNLLNSGDPRVSGTHLCINVLKTLTAILAKSRSSKRQFRKEIGYDQLKDLILRCERFKPSSELFAQLFDMLVDASNDQNFDEEKRYTIQNPDIVQLMFQLLPYRSRDEVNEFLATAILIIEKSQLNQSACCSVNLTITLLDMLPRFSFPETEANLVHLIEILGRHSITVAELKRFFFVLKNKSTKSTLPLLLKAVQRMTLKEGPEAYFDFDGIHSGLELPAIDKWPSTRGYTACMWIRIEELEDPEGRPKYHPRLYSFQTADGQGFEVFFEHGFLSAMVSLAGKVYNATFDYQFQAKQWYFVAVAHGKLPFGRSEIRLYVNGELKERTNLKFPLISKILTHCRIGSNVPMLAGTITSRVYRETPFFGQMGAIYLFDDFLTPVQVASIFNAGPNYTSTFRHAEGIEEDDFDSSLSGKIFLCYNSKSCEDKVCLDNSPETTKPARLDARVLGGSHRCVSHNVKDIIGCLGGIKVLFPLVGQIDQMCATDFSSESVLITQLLACLADLLRGSRDNQEDMLRCRGFAVLSFLLKRVNPRMLTCDTVTRIRELLSVVAVSEPLYSEAISHLVFDGRLWVYAAPEVQKELYGMLVAECTANRALCEAIRKYVGVQRLFDDMKWFFWYTDGSANLAPESLFHAPSKTTILRPPPSVLKEIRTLMLQILHQILANNISKEETQAILSCLLVSTDSQQNVDLLQFFLDLLFVKNSPIPEHLTSLHGMMSNATFNLFVNLLRSEEVEPARILVLKALGKYLSLLPHASARFRQLVESPHAFCEMHSVLAAFPFNVRTYHCLMEIMVGCVTSFPQDSDVLDPMAIEQAKQERVFEFGAVLAPLLRLMATAEPCARLEMLQDFSACFKNSPENREQLIKIPSWYNLLTAVMVLPPDDPSKDGDVIGAYVVEILNYAVFHSLHCEREGYRALDMVVAALNDLHLKTKSIDPTAILRTLLCRLMDTYISHIENRLIEISPDPSARQAHVLNNFVHVVLLVEEHCFYSKFLAESFQNMSNQAVLNAPPPIAGGGMPGGRAAALLGAEYSTGLDDSSSNPDLSTLRISGASNELDSDQLSTPHHSANMSEIAATPPTTTTTAEQWIVTSSPLAVDLTAGSVVSESFDSEMALNTSFGDQPQSTDSPSLSGLVGASGSIPPLPSASAPEAAHDLSWDPDADIHVENGVWLDQPLVEKVLAIFTAWGLIFYPEFGMLPGVVTTPESKKHLRRGGCLRIALRFLCHCPVTAENATRLRLVIEKDIEAEMQRQRFSELWTVMGEMEDDDEFHTRLLYVLGFLFERISQKPDTEEARISFDLVRHILEIRKNVMERCLQDMEGRSLIGATCAFMQPDATVYTFLKTFAEPMWQMAVFRHFAPFLRRVVEDERQMARSILTRHTEAFTLWQHTDRDNHKHETNYERQQNSCSARLRIAYGNEERKRQTDGVATYEDAQRCIQRMWRRILRSISNERGPWGEGDLSTKRVFWKLDKYEDPARARRRLKRNHEGSDHKDAKRKSVHDPKEEKPEEVRITSGSKMGGIGTGPRAADPSANMDDVFNPDTTFDFLDSETLSGATASTGSAGPGASSAVPAEPQDNKALSFPCEFITPMQAYSGTFELTSTHIVYRADKENKCRVCGGEKAQKAQERLLKSPKDQKWTLDRITEVYIRPYRLRRTGIEIFFTSHSSIFINFTSDQNAIKILKKIYSKSPLNLIKADSIRPEDIFRKGQWTQMWQRRQISNFEYLMKLNSLAGRTYNDLSQYFVFPWIISDYKSEKLDLKDPTVYRDLSKPVGALSQSRAEEARMRYETWEDEVIPKFNYGTHYSNAGSVLFYLIRLEPFTTFHRVLQSGSFDHTDRLFHSLQQVWAGVSTNSADMKELIPEFYYLPEFLYNTNAIDFGRRQDGKVFNDVMLPPWADSPEEFVRINREALESDHVSEHLHEWIDLIFGEKQRGQKAAEALNVFYYLTYEKGVNWDAIEDEQQRTSLLDQISSFGQTPIQLLTKPHPKRLKVEDALRPFLYSPVSFKPFIRHDPGLRSPVACIRPFTDRLLVMHANGVVACHKFSLTQQQGVPFTFQQDTVLAPRKMGAPFAQGARVTSQFFACPVASSRDAFRDIARDVLFSCGHWDNSFKCSQLSSLNVLQTVWRHKGMVSCLGMGSDPRTLVTGSKDTTLMVWDVQFTSSAVTVAQKPRHILYGHDDEVTCMAVSSELDIVASGSKDATCILHTVRSGRYIRTIAHPARSEGKGSIDLIAMSPQGHIVLYSQDDLMLHLYSANGKKLKSAPTNGDLLSCMWITDDGEYLVTGGEKKLVVVRRLYNLSVVFKQEVARSAIRSVAVNQELQNIFVGLEDGSLIIFGADLSAAAAASSSSWS